MNSKDALDYLTSKKYTGGNIYLKLDAMLCKNIIKKDLERLEELELKEKLLNKLLDLVQFTDRGSWYLDICESDFDFVSECTEDEIPENINYLMRRCLIDRVKEVKRNER